MTASREYVVLIRTDGVLAAALCVNIHRLETRRILMPLADNLPHLLAYLNRDADALARLYHDLVQVQTQEDVAVVEEVSVWVYNFRIVKCRL